MNIFIHRRDLRIQDNTTLEFMQKQIKEKITPIFIFNPKQIYPKKNKYFSNNLVEFMCDSLKELHNNYRKRKLNMLFFEGDILKILTELHKENNINSVGFNIDYSPFSKKRDAQIKKWCNKNTIKFFCIEDMLLVDIYDKKSINPNSGNPYVVFTPFLRHATQFEVKKPSKYLPNKGLDNKVKMSNKFIIKIDELEKYYTKNTEKNVVGGRKNAKKILMVLSKKALPFNVYNEQRNMLEYKTTMLSAYINLGVISIRECYYSIKNKNSGIITELYWRDFYYNILNFFPEIVGGSFKKKYDKLKWENNPHFLEKLKRGETGVPVVDACMRQLNRTGYMHNRGRMIVSSFLTKDLLIDWRKGEQYFAQNLIDYNISANNGGWQWAAGTGTDAQPFFRIFNPWTQSQKFDPECRYIKKWVPELKDIEPKKIHEWNKYYDEKTYLKPIVDHGVQRKKALDMYKSVS